MFSLASLVLTLAASAVAVQVSFDPVYDNAAQSLETVECSSGSNGLLTKGFTTFGSLPSFPNITAAEAITKFNSVNCGTCWALTSNGVTVNVLAIDKTTGFTVSLAVMDIFTNGQSQQSGVVEATAQQVNTSLCGLK